MAKRFKLRPTLHRLNQLRPENSFIVTLLYLTRNFLVKPRTFQFTETGAPGGRGRASVLSPAAVGWSPGRGSVTTLLPGTRGRCARATSSSTGDAKARDVLVRVPALLITIKNRL